MASEAPGNTEKTPSVAPEGSGDTNMTNAPGAPDAPPAEEENPVAPGPEPKLPTHKDVSLRELLHKMDDYSPIVR